MLFDAAEVAVDGDADLVGKQRGELEGEGAKHGCVVLGIRSANAKWLRIRSANTKCEDAFCFIHPRFQFFLRVRRARLDFLKCLDFLDRLERLDFLGRLERGVCL